MAPRNLKMTVTGGRVINPEDALNIEKQMEAELAPPVAVPVPPQPLAEEVARAPEPMPTGNAAPAMPMGSPRTPPADHTADLMRAQEQARNSHFIGNVGRAGQSAIQAVTGIGGNGVFDDISKNADSPLHDLDARVAFEKDQAAQAAKYAADDPASPQNRLAQEAIKKTSPQFAAMMGERLPSMTQAQIEHFLGLHTAGTKFDDAREKWKSDASIKDADRAEKGREFDSELPVKKANAVSGRIVAMRDPSKLTVEDRQRPIDERKDVDRADKLGKISTPFAQYHAAFQVLDNLAPGLSHGKVPANWPLTSEEKLKLKDPTGLSARVLGVKPEAQAVHQALEELIDLTSRDRSGAVLNAAEVQRYVTMIRNGIAAGPEQTAIAVNALRHAVASKVRNAQASFKEASPYSSKSPYDIYKDRGGIVSEDSVFADAPAEDSSDADDLASLTPPQPATSPGPHPVDTKAEVQEPDQAPEDVVYVYRRGSDEDPVAVPADKAAVFMGNPNYEVRRGR